MEHALLQHEAEYDVIVVRAWPAGLTAVNMPQAENTRVRAQLGARETLVDLSPIPSSQSRFSEQLFC